MDEKIVENAMQIIMHAGDARNCCQAALDAIAAGDMTAAAEHLREADERIAEAPVPILFLQLFQSLFIGRKDIAHLFCNHNLTVDRHQCILCGRRWKTAAGFFPSAGGSIFITPIRKI